MSITARMIRGMPRRAMPVIRRLHCRLKGLGDGAYVARTGYQFLPPAELRFHVGSVDRENYVQIGRRCADDLTRAIGSVGRDWTEFNSLLDFGCGCGRTLAWLRDLGPTLHGVDLHAGCVAWCAERLDFATVSVNCAKPPLAFTDRSFDLIVSLSVFTHLDEDDQFTWLDELHRVSRPGAVLLLSTHGAHAWQSLSADDARTINRRGILVKEAHALWGVFEKYYNTFHSENYLRSRWSQRFRVLSFIPRGLNDHQDLTILARP
jgi:2-polyprenyl-3-methyl-5-hydroxy-6-metoxy-1,4-benzoquinol methylase